MQELVAKQETSFDATIRRARQLEPEAFDEIVDRYSRRLHGFLRRLCGNEDDAQDLVQEVFVRVVRMIQSYHHDGRFEAWLFRIALNLVRDRARRQTRTPDVVSFDSVSENDDRDHSGWKNLADPAQPQAGDPFERIEEVDRMQRAMERLPRSEREVILLRHYSQMSFAEIAAMMETPLGTALARAHRGLAKLREWMESPDGH